MADLVKALVGTGKDVTDLVAAVGPVGLPVGLDRFRCRHFLLPAFPSSSSAAACTASTILS